MEKRIKKLTAKVPESNEILTTREAVLFLRTTKATLLKMIHQGKIPCARVGNGFRFLKSELEDFLRGKYKDNQKESGENE